MKSTALALCAVVFAGFAAGQNGNDPLILNDRTGLDPVVYDSFSTSYTKIFATNINAYHDDSTPVSVCVGAKATSETESRVKASPAPNTFMRTTTSIECWHDGYPCSDRGAQYPNFGYPTTPPGVERRMMPIETDSMPADTEVPGLTQVPAETGEDRRECTAPTLTSADFNILPIPSSLGGTDQWTTTSADFNILPIPSSLGGHDQWSITRHRPHLPETTHEHSPIPKSWWRGPTPTSADFNILPIPSSLGGTDQWTTTSAGFNILPIPSSLGGHDQWSITHHRPLLPETTHEHSPIPTSWWRGPSSCTEDNDNDRNNDAITSHTQHRAHKAGIPIDFWCGPHKSIVPDFGIAPTTEVDPTATQDFVESLHFPAVPPIATFTDRSYSSFVPASSDNPLPTSVAVTDPCYLHYCPDGVSSPGVLPTTMQTVTKAEPVVNGGPSST